jgi:hypothetical protein
VYTGDPPEALTEADPLEEPQVAWVKEVDALSAVGCVTARVVVIEHPLISVTVTDHVPAVSAVTDGVPSPVGLPGAQL